MLAFAVRAGHFANKRTGRLDFEKAVTVLTLAAYLYHIRSTLYVITHSSLG